MLYRICTENINYADVLNEVSRYFPAFTVINAGGVWHGAPEHALIIEIVTDDNNAVRKLAYWIRKHNKQECVMVQEIHCEIEMM